MGGQWGILEVHYYQKNIGDYYKKAGRLSMLQHGAYTVLKDACYDRERFPTKDEAIDWTWASSKEEIEAVEFVLSKFFKKEGDVYVQNRIKEEIESYRIKSLINKLISIAREANKKNHADLAESCNSLREQIKNDPLSKTYDAWTERVEALINTHEAPPNQEPITNNQEPITNIKRSPKGSAATPEPKQVWHAEQREKISDAYNLAIQNLDKSKFSKWTDNRIAKLKTRCNEDLSRDLDWWLRIIADIPNHSAAVEGAWFTLDFLLESEDRLCKYIEGKYKKSFSKPKQDLSKLSNEQLSKMADDMGIPTQGLYRPDLITAINGKMQ